MTIRVKVGNEDEGGFEGNAGMVPNEETIIGRRSKKTLAGEKVFRERTIDKLGSDSVPEEDTLVHTALDDIGQPVVHPENLVKTNCCDKMLRADSLQKCPVCCSPHICAKHMTRLHMCRVCYFKEMFRRAGWRCGWTIRWMVVLWVLFVIWVIIGIFSNDKKPPNSGGHA